jgi:hypothetical protein
MKKILNNDKVWAAITFWTIIGGVAMCFAILATF